eukprot:7829583-Pyramimonas_sp.AAC.1
MLRAPEGWELARCWGCLWGWSSLRVAPHHVTYVEEPEGVARGQMTGHLSAACGVGTDGAR